jgi:hypothetical protein
MRWLHAEHGNEKIRALFEESRGKRGASHAARAFESVYGFSIETAESRFIEEAAEVYPDVGVCDYPTLEWNDGVVEAMPELDCSEPHTLGWRNLERRFTVDVAEAGYYVVSVEEPGYVRVEQCYPDVIPVGTPIPTPTLPVGQISGGWDPDDSAQRIDSGTTRLWLEPGMHRIRLRVDGTTAQTVGLVLRRSSLQGPRPGP